MQAQTGKRKTRPKMSEIELESDRGSSVTKPLTTWDKISEVIWDGKRTPEERMLVQRLDLFVMYVEPSAPGFLFILSNCMLQAVGRMWIFRAPARCVQHLCVSFAVRCVGKVAADTQTKPMPTSPA